MKDTQYKCVKYFVISGLCTLSMLLLPFVLQSQDPFFSQFFNAPVYLNSGFAGISEQYMAAVNYRNEYPLFADPLSVYSSYSFSLDKFFTRYNSGIGLIFYGNQGGNGLISQTGGSILYSYRVHLGGQHYVRGGMEIGGISRRYGWKDFLFPDQLEGLVRDEGAGPTNELPPGSYNQTKLDLSFGVLFHHPNYFAGISWKHLNTPDLSILHIRPEESRNNSLPIRWSLQGGYKWNINETKRFPSFISANIVYVQQGPLRQLNMTGIYKFSKVFAGVGYRYAFQNFDAAIFSFGWMTGRMTAAYSFDFTLSRFGIANGGSHELAVRYGIGRKDVREGKTACYSFY